MPALKCVALPVVIEKEEGARRRRHHLLVLLVPAVPQLVVEDAVYLMKGQDVNARARAVQVMLVVTLSTIQVVL